MKLLQYLKALADLTFLYCTFGTIVAMIFPYSGGWITPALLAVVPVVAYLLRGKGYRYVALILAVIALPLSTATADWVMVVIALAYLALSVKKEGYHYESMEEIDHFHLQIKIILAAIFVGYVLGRSDVVVQRTLPTLLLYLVSTNLLLRTLQGGEEALKSPALLRFNLLSLVGVMVAATVLTSERVLTAMGTAISTFYHDLLIPLFLWLITALLWVLNAIYQLLSGLFSLEEEAELTEVSVDIMSMAELFEGEATTTVDTPSWVITVAIAVVVAIAIALLVLLLRYMLRGTKGSTAGDYVTVTTLREDTEGEKEGRSLFLSPRQKVRKYYAEFISHAKKHRVSVEPSTDTAQLERRYGVSPETTALRDCYRRARYDHKTEVGKEQATQAKAALKAIKSKGKT